MEQALTLVALALPATVPLDRLRMRSALLLPVAGVIGAPLASTLAADLAILRIGSELLLTAVCATALLAHLVGAHRLLGMTSGGFERLIAITAAPAHPQSVKESVLLYRPEK